MDKMLVLTAREQQLVREWAAAKAAEWRASAAKTEDPGYARIARIREREARDLYDKVQNAELA